MAERISIEFSRFSAFYSPLIATFACGFLQEEGFAPHHAVATSPKSATQALMAGSVHVAQSAVSQAFPPLERGEKAPILHFAQINERDGFFIAGRARATPFRWEMLTAAPILVEHGGQPFAMFKYACKKKGLDWAAVQALDPRGENLDKAFRAGKGTYVHMQGPAPQQLAHDGVGHVVASVGEAIGPVAFSSLAATPAWLATPAARRFMRAYRKARAWIIATPADGVAAQMMPYFPGVDPSVLSGTIAAYQKLDTWSPHVEITRDAYHVAVDVFHSAGMLKGRPRYEDAVVSPPDA